MADMSAALSVNQMASLMGLLKKADALAHGRCAIRREVVHVPAAADSSAVRESKSSGAATEAEAVTDNI